MAHTGEAPHGGSPSLPPPRSARLQRIEQLQRIARARRSGWERRQPPRGRSRWLGWVTSAILLFSGLSIALVWLGHNLDRPWIKARIVALVKEQAGLDVDYAELDVSLLDGVRADSLQVLTPASLAAGADTFLRIDGVELSWRLWALVSGVFEIRALRVGSIDVAVVSDEHGRTTLSELFPEPPEPEPSGRLSQSLAELPKVALHRLEIDAVRARSVELRGGQRVRAMELGSLRAQGRLYSDERGLAGSELRVIGAPRLELTSRSGDQLRRAVLGLELNINAVAAAFLALRARLELSDQDLAPGWPRAAELLALAGTLRFDGAAGRTSLELPLFRALAETISVSGRGEIFDGGELRVVTSGTAAAHVAEWPPRGMSRAALPESLAKLSLGAFDLDLGARELSWQRDRISGALDVRGRVSGLRYEDALSSLRLDLLTLVGGGRIEDRQGRFQARLEASPAWRAAPLSAELDSLTLEVSGTSSGSGAAQALDVESLLAIRSARLRSESESVAIEGTKLRSRVSGALAQLADRVIPLLDADLRLARVEAAGGGTRSALDGVAASALLRGLALDAASASGLRGSAELSLAADALRVAEPPRKGRARSSSLLALDGLTARTALQLSRGDLEGRLGIDALRVPQASLAGLALEFAALNPLALAPETDSPAPSLVSSKGRIARVSAGTARAAIDELRVFAQRRERDGYRIELDVDAGALAARGRALPGRLRTELRVDAAPVAGNLVLGARLRGLTKVDLDVNARLDRNRERVHYRAGLAAEPLTPLAALVTAAAPEAAGYSITARRLKATGSGELSGVLRNGPSLAPVLALSPLESARGWQKLSLELDGADVRAPDRWVAVPGLSIDIESQHGKAGSGRAETHVRVAGLEYEGGGSALRLTGLDHRLNATFDRVPGQGLIDVRSQLALDSAAQSWAPGYPVRDVRWSTDLQLDRLVSVYLRDLTFDNPGAGTSLKAAGALEVTARGTPSVTGSRTLVGREALSLEGRLTQELAPLERAGSLARSTGTLALPFRLESGGLLGYRFLATLEADEVSFQTHDRLLQVEDLNARVPIVEEFALLPGGLVLGVDPRASPLSDARFFDVHPFLAEEDYVTADAIRIGSLPVLGPLAANLRIERTGFILQQLQVGFSGGQIVGQSRVAYRDGDPIVRLRLNATGLRSPGTEDIFDANATLSFEPAALTLDGKMQIVRASRSHVLDMLDVLDPFRESANANRVRAALAVGYPKFVRFKLHDGTVDAKVELGGMASLVRIGEIKAVPIGPLLKRYVEPTVTQILPPRPARKSPVMTSREQVSEDGGSQSVMREK